MARRLGGFGRVYKRDNEDLNWASGTGDGKDRFERDLKGRIVRACRWFGGGWVREKAWHIHTQ